MPLRNVMLISQVLESIICMCELFFEEKANGTSKHIDEFYTKTTQKGGFSKLCVKMEKRCYTDLLHFSTRKHSIFFRPNRISYLRMIL
jgi:hypothetical protein